MNRQVNSAMSIYEKALITFNQIFQKHQLDSFPQPKHPTRAYRLLLRVGYLGKKNKQNYIKPGYKAIGLTSQRYAHDVVHENQFNKSLWKHYSWRHFTLKNTSIKVFFLIMVVCYCLYFGISRPDILYNTTLDNVFFGFIFPIIISIIVTHMYQKEMYNMQYHNNRKAEYIMYLKGQADTIQKLYKMKKGR